jgi:ATP-dependent 26S proteasome regulatory subunit
MKVFEYVQKSCGNGIIIFEDIDCMSNIVLDRELEYSREKTLTEVMEMDEDSLSLSFLLNLLDGSLSSDGSVFIMTTNYRERLDRALIRKGRVDVDIEMKCCDHYMVSEIYRDFTKKDISPGLLEKINDNLYTPADIIFHLAHNFFNTSDEEELMEPFTSIRGGAEECKNPD